MAEERPETVERRRGYHDAKAGHGPAMFDGQYMVGYRRGRAEIGCPMEHKPARLDPRDDGCLCSGCGKRYKVDLMLPDDTWKAIETLYPNHWVVADVHLCPMCIATRLERLGRFDSFTMTRTP